MAAPWLVTLLLLCNGASARLPASQVRSLLFALLFCRALAYRSPPFSQRTRRFDVALVKLMEYEDASPEVRAVYDDIMTSRKVDWINNFWKALASDPATLKRTWESVKEV